MERLGVPHTLAQNGATPGVLRGSGATFLYLETEDINLVAWRGRWSKVKTRVLLGGSGAIAVAKAASVVS